MEVPSATRKKGRRVWTNEEMLALLEALENQVQSGGISPSGNLKPGTATKMEQELAALFPNSGLKADPQIVSAVKSLKAQHHLITELLAVSGFGWNDEKKCIVCDSDDAWNTYVQKEKRVKNYRNKSFPYYERLLGIFGKDRPNGQESITVGDARDEINKEVDGQIDDDFFVEERMEVQSATRKKGHRVWTNEEMLALLEALENQLRSGGISPGGNLKPGTATKMEQELAALFPNSGLRADPHIVSAVKSLRTQHHLITEMLAVGGFGWNDEKKCIVCDIDDAWNTYVQKEKRVKNYRNKSFPYYDRLLGIFGKDRANRQDSVIVGDARDESNKEADGKIDDDAFVEERSVNQTARTNVVNGSSARKRAKVAEMLSASINNLGDKIVEVMTKSRESVDKLVDSISSNKKLFEDQRAVCGELKNMDLTTQERVIAARKVLDNPQNVHIFWGFDGEDRVAYVKHLIYEN